MLPAIPFVACRFALVPIFCAVVFSVCVASVQAITPEAGPAKAQEGVLQGQDFKLDESTSYDTETRFIESLLSTMSIEQKVAQMIQADIRYVTPDDVRRYGIGSVLNGGGAFPNMDKHASLDDWLALADAYYLASTDRSGGSAGVPLLWGTDAVHGHNNVYGATIFPHNIGLGATRNAALVEMIAESTALEVRASGIDWIFAPTLAVSTDLRWGRSYESFSSDPELVAEMGAAVVRGIQRTGAIATAKHFIGDGATYRGIDQGDARLSKRELIDVHGAGYRAAIEAEVQTVMASFNSWNGVKVHGHGELLKDLLREEMGFTGPVVSDWNGLGQIRFCSNSDCPEAFNAGIDIAMVPTQWETLLHNTVRQVKSGEIPGLRIDEAVTRILRLKYRAGLFSGKKPSERKLAAETTTPLVGNKEHRALAAQAVRQSLVLLKLQNDVLPLDSNAQILVAGSAAHSMQMQTGGWSLTWQGTGNSNSDFPGGSTIFDGIARRVARSGGKAELSVDGSFEQRPDIALVVFGEQPYAEGQGDVEHLNHSARYPKDLQVMRELQAANIPVISVFVTGRPAWVNKELNASDAFIVAWLPGSEGSAIADVLFASVDSEGSFRGRLPMPWPATDVDLQDVSLPVKETLFPIGYGLTLQDRSPNVAYSETSYAPEAVEKEVVFSSRSQPPWMMMLGDSYNWNMRVESSAASSEGNRISVEAFDRWAQQDARRITWTSLPGKYAQIYWSHAGEETYDFSAVFDREAVMAIQMSVNSLPTGRVLARVDCTYPCSGEVNITQAILARTRRTDGTKVQQNATDQWFDLLIPMTCFRNAGARLESVSAPLVLLADGGFSASISDVRLRPRRSGDQVLDCSEQSRSRAN